MQNIPWIDWSSTTIGEHQMWHSKSATGPNSDLGTPDIF